ncbi:ABC-2 family transporter protein [Candidatus Gottesmanbacteria bacterium]|nr:ABC-2 family transporter protein [Candidatus Gottesmanbacteria bacterium]MBI5452004.1 ABC-2 family transporter protein [Candidatus Gottesmanbacteria bacterium]
MKKYLMVINNGLQEYFTYRLNFVLWRVRVIVAILISYFLWNAVYSQSNQVFGYGQSQMMTYILLTIFINGIVFSTQTFRVAEEINYGILSRYLIRPLNYFVYNLSRDFADKLINTSFSVIEFLLLVFLLKPPIIFQTNPLWILLFVQSVIFAAILYFEISLLISFIGFWSNETWAPRFLFFILVSFLAGNYFPLDIFPPPIYKILELLPFTYLLFYPLKIYIGQVSSIFIIKGFLSVIFWIIALYFILRLFWRKGLKVYTAEGQ